jgi:perosamine synthetase
MIPVCDPVMGDEEVEAVAAAVRRGEISGSFGPSIPAFERAFADYCGAGHGVAVSSGTAALHLAAAAAGIGAGDEVLVSASTNIATAVGVYHLGGVPVPIDSEPDTWNLDLDLLEEAITPRTRAIIPVHLFGHPVDMDRVVAIARRHGLVVIEDAAQSPGACCRGRRVGTFGHTACFSFYANKHITTGEGGMVVTDDGALADRLRSLRNLGYATPRFRHEVAGYNFRLTGYQAALGLAQVGRLEAVIAAKRRLAEMYTRHLRDIPGLRLPVERDWARHVYWMYALVVTPEFGATRDELADRLRARGVDTRTFFCPMNRQPCFAHLERCAAQRCPVAEELWRSGLYLPSSPSLDEAQVMAIAGALRAARGDSRGG